MNDVAFGEVRGVLRAFEFLGEGNNYAPLFQFHRFEARPSLVAAVASWLRADGSPAPQALHRSRMSFRDDVIRYARPWLSNRGEQRLVTIPETPALGWGQDVEPLLTALTEYFDGDVPEVWELARRHPLWTGVAPAAVWDALVLAAGDTAHLLLFGWDD